MSPKNLPIDPVLPEVVAALADKGRVVLQAPPGAGKTTRVPLALDAAGITSGKIVMLEPRRLAARAAAARMAQSLGERLGQSVGYRIRGETKVSRETRIEVVTEGILTRMLQADPELPGVGCVIFDEFHERSVNADLGLALCLESAEALRDDLQLVVMSATLDAAPVAALMGGAPLVTSEGRSFDVEIRWRDTPLGPRQRLESAVADTILSALREAPGALLAFLPGQGEIRRTAQALHGRLPPDVRVQELYGAMPFDAQQKVLAPVPDQRSVVLATAIAETSLTIPDIRIVVDAGKARRARFDPGSGMTRLITEPASRAEATQRAGRAGRVAPGLAYRLWTRGEDGARPEFSPPEIAVTDLAPLALDVALWGTRVSDLPLLDQPPAGPWAEAHVLLQMLGALNAESAPTEHGRDLARLPLHPRLGHMLIRAGRNAAPLAALLSDRDPLRDGSVDMVRRLKALATPKDPALKRIATEAKRLASLAGETSERLSPAQQAALAYPDRIGLRRKGSEPRYLLSGGKGAVLPSEDALAGERLLVITDTDGHPREARVRQALSLTEFELRALFADQIVWHDACQWSEREGRVLARRQERFEALVLEDRIWKDAPQDAIATAMLDGVRSLGLRFSDAAQLFRARVNTARAGGLDMPDLSEPHLMETLETWLLPFLGDMRTATAWRQFDVLPALKASLSWDQNQRLDAAVPGSFVTPLGRKIPIDYSAAQPEITLRLQEMFGQASHPQVAGQPLRVTLLSPAGRPVQTTLDIPGFWRSSYADVRRDMRGRYPKHPWPENPLEADPTLRAKPRKR